MSLQNHLTVAISYNLEASISLTLLQCHSSSNFSVFVFITALYFTQFRYTEVLAAGESVLSFTYS